MRGPSPAVRAMAWADCCRRSHKHSPEHKQELKLTASRHAALVHTRRTLMCAGARAATSAAIPEPHSATSPRLSPRPRSSSQTRLLTSLRHAALAHQADFDVCWCKGSVADLILLPLADFIRRQGGTITGSTFAQDLVLNPAGTGVSAVKVVDKQGKQSTLEADAVVFAVGINGALGGESPLAAWNQQAAPQHHFYASCSDCPVRRVVTV